MIGRTVKYQSKSYRNNGCNHHPYLKSDKKSARKHKRWQETAKPFRCAHCKQMILPTDGIGTVHRNHCPFCLWSLHVDTKPGNRASTCHGRMEPVGLTFKHNGFDKYGRPRTGDVMIVHCCRSCLAININRIAGDDSTDGLFSVFSDQSLMQRSILQRIEAMGIDLLGEGDKGRLHMAIFGKT